MPEENIAKTVQTKPTSRISHTLDEEETVDAGFKPHTRKRNSTTNYSNEPNYETTIALNSNTTYTEIAELSKKVKSMMLVSENPAPGGQRICKVCGKEGSMTAIVDHIESNHISGISLPCNICGKTSPTRNTLAKHKSRFHKQ